MAIDDQSPTELHVRIRKGDAWRRAFTVNLDLTGYDIAATIHPKGADDVEMAVDVTDAEEGEFSVLLSVSASASLADGAHPWCLTLTPPHVDPAPAETRTFVAGRFLVDGCR